MNFLKKYKYLILGLVAGSGALIIYMAWVRSTRKKVKEAMPNNNIQAFLKMIRHSEGTDGVNGYKTLFGGKPFSSFTTHPNVHVPYKNTYSTAAGAYQILYRTWQRLCIILDVKDFSPETQDKMAIELIRENGALDDVIAGRFSMAVSGVKKVWASLPGAGYGQPENKLADLLTIYTKNGGQLA